MKPFITIKRIRKKIRSLLFIRLIATTFPIVLIFCTIQHSVKSYKSIQEAKIGNVVFLYTDRGKIPDTIPFWKALTYYIGYYDSSYVVRDNFFEGAVVVNPSVYATPEKYYVLSKESMLNDLEILFDQYYEPLKSPIEKDSSSFLDHLERATSEVINPLGYKFKFKIILTIPYNFIDDFPEHITSIKDEKTLNFRESLDAFKVFKDFIDEILRRWKGKKYKYIELHGMYWMHEYFPRSSIEASLIPSIRNYLLKHSLRFYASPHLESNFGTYEPTVYQGMEKYFDAIWLQPGYWSSGYGNGGSLSQDPLRLHVGIQIAKDRNFGINMEWHGDSNSTYLRYLSLGYDAGYVYSTHLFFESNGQVWEAATSSDPQIRKQYDETYKFIKESKKKSTKVN